jgi:hypothetical protein
MPLRRAIGNPPKQEEPQEPQAEKEAMKKTPLLNLLIERAPNWEREEYIKVINDIHNESVFYRYRARVEKLKEEWKNAEDREIHDYLTTYFKLHQILIMDKYNMRPPLIPENFSWEDYCNLMVIKGEIMPLAKLWNVTLKEVRESLDIKAIFPTYEEYI